MFQMIRKGKKESTHNVEEQLESFDRPFSRHTESSPKRNIYTPILVVLLLVASYLLGMLTTKIQYLEKTSNAAEVTAQAAPQQPQTGQNPVLGTDTKQPAKKVEIEIGSAPVQGDSKAPVTIIEFSDFQCPYCKQFFDTTISQIKTEYVKTGKVKFAYKHFPLSFHQNAQKAAEASECANEQNKFWEYHDQLFSTQSTWESQDAATAATTFTSYATQLGLDATQFSSCLSSSKYKQKVEQDAALGAQVGVTGTPGTFINGQLIVGAQPYATFKTIIDAELAKK